MVYEHYVWTPPSLTDLLTSSSLEKHFWKTLTICIFGCLHLLKSADAQTYKWLKFLVVDVTWLVMELLYDTLPFRNKLNKIDTLNFLLCVPIYIKIHSCLGVSGRDIHLYNWTWLNLKLSISFRWHLIVIRCGGFIVAQNYSIVQIVSKY